MEFNSSDEIQKEDEIQDDLLSFMQIPLPELNEETVISVFYQTWNDFMDKFRYSIQNNKIEITEMKINSSQQNIGKICSELNNALTYFKRSMQLQFDAFQESHRGKDLLENIKKSFNTILCMGWTIELKSQGWVFKKYTHHYPVQHCYNMNKTRRLQYKTPIVYLDEINVTISRGKILNITLGIGRGYYEQHPNASDTHNACLGDFKYREIDTTKVDSLVNLLKDIENTYKAIHLYNPYYTPEVEYIDNEGEAVWTT